MKELWRLIPSEYRRGCVRLAALVPVKAVLDIVGVAVLVPVLMLVLNPDKLRNSFVWTWAMKLGICPDDFVPALIVAVILALALKIILSLFIINYQNTFLMKMYRNISSRLFVSLYSRGLVFIKNNNSAKMTFNVMGVCYNFVFGYLGGWLRLSGEIVFVLMLFSALMIYSTRAGIMALCAFIPVMIIYLLCVRRPVREMSRKENDLRREQYRLINEAFKGYSEVQVNDAFPFIQQRFYRGLGDIATYKVRSSLLQSFPSYFLELSVVVIVSVLLLFNINAMDPGTIVFLSVFAVSIIKLMPSIKAIISSSTALSATKYTTSIIEEINRPAIYPVIHDEKVQAMEFNDAIRVDNVTFCFEDDDTPVIDKVSFTVPKGSRFGIVGRTGAGKTTLFNLLLGLYTPNEGRVMIDGVELTQENVASWHKIVGYVPQDVFISDSTVLENVALGYESKDIDRDRVMAALQMASMKDFIDSLPEGPDTRLGEAGCKLSGGQKQRIGIARALYKDASVLFFDEATSSLDVQTENEVNEAIKTLSENNRNLTIIVISHRESTMSFCNDLFRL